MSFEAKRIEEHGADSGFASDLRLRGRYRPVAGAAAIGVIALGRPGSLALKDSRMDALAVTALA